MELVQDLFVTASFALLFSFIIAKLVSMAVSGDAARDSELKSRENASPEEVRSGERLRVGGFASERRVDFLGEATGKVNELKGDEFVGGSESDRAELNLRSLHGGEVVEEQCREVVGVGDVGRIEAAESSKEESDLVGVSEKLSDAAEIAGVSELEGIEGKEVGSGGLDSLVAEEKEENTEGDEIGKGELGTGRDSFVVQQCEDVEVVKDGKDQGSGGEDEDEWEGIEKSELEKVFAAATKFVGVGGEEDRLANVSGDVQMQLYGLHKVAMEGPCYESQPMALKVSARAKWVESCYM
ncbi:acyl-CoA-binding domain-containing protein 3 isoform X2 [Malania oleifera]|uniref:acyl-CoA-binding domain-containing protein 3 isoform X2 n=1 Tax=Malania oleifera TaxID=397392 RepID=UPI0025AEBDEE|nr:acyl-CoA-binding domain-containing protein 3 isoform X2 [Malania oleifera]